VRRGAAVLAAAGLVMQSPPTRGFAAAPAPRCGGDAVRECQLSLLTTQPDDGIQPLLDRFAEAQTSIDYAPFVFSSPRIAQALKDAKDRGVRVRVLLEVYPGDDGITAMDGGDMLANFGIAWRPTNQQYLLTHAKYAIIDSSQAFIWTFNSDEGDLSQKRDFGIVDEDPDDVTFVQALFDADWRLLRTPPIPEGFVVSPDNSTRRWCRWWTRRRARSTSTPSGPSRRHCWMPSSERVGAACASAS
jgi:phosphatidylserine/phosphatidylglycerophosphate/cardiolipin synthase-like enzyme